MKFQSIGLMVVVTAISAVSVLANVRLGALHNRIDSNQDRVISFEEFIGFWSQRYDELDIDDDGLLIEGEYIEGTLEIADKDADGAISIEEHRRLRERHFQNMDKNQDMQITLSEMLGAAANRSAIARPTKSLEFATEWEAFEALSELTTIPKMWLAEGYDSTDDLAAIYFNGLDWKRKSTRVFAWLGLPEGRTEKVPGVVLVHGGGGTAFKGWVQRWNKRGYAAISIAVEGQTDIENPQGASHSPWIKHKWAGPQRSGIYQDSQLPIEEQWIYHAVADTILANSLLRSLVDVDAEQVGIMGISWGGVITSTVIGLDERFAFAIPTYGCGGLDTAENQYGQSLGNNDIYRQVLDPMLRLSRAKMPTLWFSWPKDSHFPLNNHAQNYLEQSGPHMVSLVPGMGHGHGSAWQRPESYAFADSVTKFGNVWCRQVNSLRLGRVYKVSFESSKPLDSAELISTVDTGVTGDRTWVQTPLTRPLQDGSVWRVSADVPPESTAWFINVKSGDLVASSDLAE